MQHSKKQRQSKQFKPEGNEVNKHFTSNCSVRVALIESLKKQNATEQSRLAHV